MYLSRFLTRNLGKKSQVLSKAILTKISLSEKQSCYISDCIDCNISQGHSYLITLFSITSPRHVFFVLKMLHQEVLFCHNFLYEKLKTTQYNLPNNVCSACFVFFYYLIAMLISILIFVIEIFQFINRLYKLLFMS